MTNRTARQHQGQLCEEDRLSVSSSFQIATSLVTTCMEQLISLGKVYVKNPRKWPRDRWADKTMTDADILEMTSKF